MTYSLIFYWISIIRLLGEMTKALTISGENIKELRPRLQSVRIILFPQKATNTKLKERKLLRENSHNLLKNMIWSHRQTLSWMFYSCVSPFPLTDMLSTTLVCFFSPFLREEQVNQTGWNDLMDDLKTSREFKEVDDSMLMLK